MRPSRRDHERQQTPSPGTITAIESQTRDPDRVSVFIDGSFAFGIARDVADQAAISQGDVLDIEAIRALLAQESRHRALSTALAYLAHRPRSEAEIRARLRRNSHDDETIDNVLERLRDWHYVDDEDFARRWVENRVVHRPRGTRALASELRSKGIDPDLISTAIDDAGVNEDDGALALARNRARQLANLEPDVRNRRLTGYLARRGYGYDVIRRTLEALESGPDE
ncbi:MAG TPA: RecX family transcriptional regulator [Thermomicrobiales bacterium]|nr:RecX family transcriptional regulator [Thermomicrobiales bacterium]